MTFILADHKLVVDATNIPYSITERGAMDDVVADRYQLCDFTTGRERGKNTKLVFGTVRLDLSNYLHSCFLYR